MLALGIHYLHGIAVGSHGEYNRVEWPPHPARVFMAMVAAHYQTGADAKERRALLELEKLPPPDIHAPEALPCSVVTQYVPVNDDRSQFFRDPQTKKIKFYQEIPGIPLRRNRQDRTFARTSLAGDTVVLRWPGAELSAADLAALGALCPKVTRIGHSSSLVQMWLADAVPDGLQHWRGDEARATHRLRVPCEGTLEELDRNFNGEPPQHRPRISTYAGYTLASEKAADARAKGSVFSPHLVVFTLERKDGPYRHLDLACTLALTDRWREAIAKHAAELAIRPEAQQLLTGHAPDNSPLQAAHVAFLPLAFVGHPHADGRLLGIALALPGTMQAHIRTEVLRAASRVCAQGLVLGRLGAWFVRPVTMARPLETLRPATWTAHPDGATQWSTVTPIAYDHHPKAKPKAEYLVEAADMIRDGCERIGLPRPREVIVTSVSAHLGAPTAHVFPRLRRKDSSERRHTHAILVFDELVCGPILIGAGRYRGYGLCRPISTGEEVG